MNVIKKLKTLRKKNTLYSCQQTLMMAYERCESVRENSENSSTNSIVKPKHLSGNLKGSYY